MRMKGGFVGEVASKAFHLHRPVLPATLTKRIADYLFEKLPSPSLAVDVGCGTGLSTCKVANVLLPTTRVLGLDVSETQIQVAKRHNDTHALFRVHDIDSGLPFEREEVDLITVVQAAHWLNLDAFWTECDRVLKEGGVVALCAYSFVRPSMSTLTDSQNDHLTALVRKLNDDLQAGGYWDTNREQLVSEYSDVVLPFADQRVYRADPSIFLRKQTTVDGFLNYMQSWSGVRNYKRQMPEGQLYDQFLQDWWRSVAKGMDGETTVTTMFPWYLLMCRKSD